MYINYVLITYIKFNINRYKCKIKRSINKYKYTYKNIKLLIRLSYLLVCFKINYLSVHTNENHI